MKTTILLLAIVLAMPPVTHAAESATEPSSITAKLLEEVHALRLAIQKSNAINAAVLITVELTKMANMKVENLELGMEQVMSDLMELDDLITSDSARLRDVTDKISTLMGHTEAFDLKTEQASLQDMVQRSSRKRTVLLEKQSNMRLQLEGEQSRFSTLQDRLKALEGGTVIH